MPRVYQKKVPDTISTFLALTPFLARYRATFLVDQLRCFTKYTASLLTLGRCGFLLYAMYVIFA